MKEFIANVLQANKRIAALKEENEKLRTQLSAITAGTKSESDIQNLNKQIGELKTKHENDVSEFDAKVTQRVIQEFASMGVDVETLPPSRMNIEPEQPRYTIRKH